MKQGLSPKRKREVRRWLSLIDCMKSAICPFSSCRPTICKSWFPKSGPRCPCFVYHLTHVKKVAKEMIGE
jgi:hypothetical protein